MSKPSSEEWVSILRLTPIILGSIVLFSLTDFGLAVAYARQLYNAPLDGSKWDYSKDKRWTVAWFILYSGFFPILSFIHTSVDVILFFFAQLKPICTLTFSILFFIGWIIQISFWCYCDYSPDSDKCYQFYVVGNPSSEMTGSLIGVSDEITAAKAAVGVTMLVFYVAYVVMAATVVQEMRKSVHVTINEEEYQEQEQELESRISMGDRNRIDGGHSDYIVL